MPGRLDALHQLVAAAYQKTGQPFARWMWQYYVPLVAANAQQLALRFGGNELAEAGALLHDFGDVFVHRSDPMHEEISDREARTLLQQAHFSDQEIDLILNQVIAPHSCKDGLLPTTQEGKIVATADAMAHLGSDFYLQFAWMHLPDDSTYDEYVAWVNGKLDRDYNQKIFFPEIKNEYAARYQALKTVFQQTQ